MTMTVRSVRIDGGTVSCETFPCLVCNGSGKQWHGTEKDPGPNTPMVQSTCAGCGGKGFYVFRVAKKMERVLLLKRPTLPDYPVNVCGCVTWKGRAAFANRKCNWCQGTGFSPAEWTCLKCSRVFMPKFGSTDFDGRCPICKRDTK